MATTVNLFFIASRAVIRLLFSKGQGLKACCRTGVTPVRVPAGTMQMAALSQTTIDVMVAQNTNQITPANANAQTRSN
jgi:hypothetical protein